MGKPLTIQLEDDARLESLKKPLGVRTKIEVVRRALDSLEEWIAYNRRVARRTKAATLVIEQSARVNKEFRPRSLLRRT